MVAAATLGNGLIELQGEFGSPQQQATRGATEGRQVDINKSIECGRMR